MAWDGVMVRFGEIGIKSAPVRSSMLEQLRQNLLSAMERAGVLGDVERQGARVWMVGPEPERLLEIASRTFGVVSGSMCRRVSADMDTIKATVSEMALAEENWTRFAIRARREGKHGYSSQDLGREAGSAVFMAMEAAGRPVQVDLSDPELAVHVDVRGERAYIFLDQVAGPGGLPVGAQGKALVLLSDRASALAAWLVMRRGAAVTALHAGDTGSVPMELVESLGAWGMSQDVELLPVCSGATSKQVLLDTACVVARESEASVLVTGDTLASGLATTDLPVLRPVCGLDDASRDRFLAQARLPEVDGAWGEEDNLLDAAASETVASLLSMRRTVSV